MTYLYARVSTKEQNLDRQIQAAEEFKKVDRIFCDKQSGKNFEREQYQLLKETVCRGDEVIIKELDRLGRNKEGNKEEIKWFKEHGVVLRILEIPTTLMDFSGQEWIKDMVDNVVIEVLASIAQQEREKIRRRQTEGIKAMPIVDGRRVSKLTGRAYGRPRLENTDFEKFLQKQKEGLMSVEECCREMGVSRSWWYKQLKSTI